MRRFASAALGVLMLAGAAAPQVAADQPGAPARLAVGVVTVASSDVPWRPGVGARVRGDDVRWDSGGGRAQMAVGIPNPPGWYRAALGPRTRAKVIYLTFDDGPTPGLTPVLLAALAKHEAHTTFFLLGMAAVSQPELVARMAREGHAVANHTWDHPELTKLGRSAVADELSRTAKVLGSAAGGCMRPPYGLINEKVAGEALARGLQPIMWTGHIEDWNVHSLDWHVARLRAATKPGAVILLHDTKAKSVAAVRQMLPEWQRMGFRLDAIPRCLLR